ncbi:MAG: flagellin [Rubrivivax sp.]|nr:flagellin [Rubrivivax sp.]
MQRHLAGVQRDLASTAARLSSGLRIQGARDDAAGLAIAERMQSQLRGATVAIRNGQDAVSLLQTADGALGHVGELLQRMRELAVQAASGAHSAGDRALLQAEAGQLVQEVDRIAAQTRFNGSALFDGSFKGAKWQLGANAGDMLAVGPMIDARAHRLPTNGIAFSVNDGIDASTGLLAGDGAMPRDALAAIAGGLTVNDADGQAIDLGKIGVATTGAQRLSQIVGAINRQSGLTGISATLGPGSVSGQYKMTLVANRDISAADFGGFGAASTGIDSGSIASGPVQAEPIDEIDLSTLTGARQALWRYDRAIDQVTQARGQLGALQTRVEAMTDSLRSSADLQQGARARVVDADFAAETAQRLRASLLQQAGMAMVAQANVQPREVLQLLRFASWRGV